MSTERTLEQKLETIKNIIYDLSAYQSKLERQEDLKNIIEFSLNLKLVQFLADKNNRHLLQTLDKIAKISIEGKTISTWLAIKDKRSNTNFLSKAFITSIPESIQPLIQAHKAITEILHSPDAKRTYIYTTASRPDNKEAEGIETNAFEDWRRALIKNIAAKKLKLNDFAREITIEKQQLLIAEEIQDLPWETCGEQITKRIRKVFGGNHTEEIDFILKSGQDIYYAPLLEWQNAFTLASMSEAGALSWVKTPHQVDWFKNESGTICANITVQVKAILSEDQTKQLVVKDSQLNEVEIGDTPEDADNIVQLTAEVQLIPTGTGSARPILTQNKIVTYVNELFMKPDYNSSNSEVMGTGTEIHVFGTETFATDLNDQPHPAPGLG